MDFIKILELYEYLEKYMKQYGDDSILYSYKKIVWTIEVLKSDAIELEKEKALVQTYKVLFTGRGGLTEFYVWNNDIKERKLINESFENICQEIRDIMKNNF